MGNYALRSNPMEGISSSVFATTDMYVSDK